MRHRVPQSSRWLSGPGELAALLATSFKAFTQAPFLDFARLACGSQVYLQFHAQRKPLMDISLDASLITPLSSPMPSSEQDTTCSLLSRVPPDVPCAGSRGDLHVTGSLSGHRYGSLIPRLGPASGI